MCSSDLAAFADHVNAALDSLREQGVLPRESHSAAVTVEPPRDPSHGDLATNAAMVLAKPAATKMTLEVALRLPVFPPVYGFPAHRSSQTNINSSRSSPAMTITRKCVSSLIAIGLFALMPCFAEMRVNGPDAIKAAVDDYKARHVD